MAKEVEPFRIRSAFSSRRAQILIYAGKCSTAVLILLKRYVQQTLSHFPVYQDRKPFIIARTMHPTGALHSLTNFHRPDENSTTLQCILYSILRSQSPHIFHSKTVSDQFHFFPPFFIAG